MGLGSQFNKSKNASRAQQMQQKMAMEGNSPVSRLIALDSIVEHEDNEIIYGMDKLDELIESIQEDGFSDPIGVYDLKNGTYEIFSGHKRYQAMTQLGEKSIPAFIFPAPKDNVERAKRLIRSNSLNRDYNPITKARELRYFYDNVIVPENKPGRKRAQLAKEFGIAESQVAKFLALLDLIPSLQKLISDEDLAFSAFSPAAQLSEEEQEQLYEQIVSLRNEDGSLTLTRGDITNLIRRLQGKEVIEAAVEEESWANAESASSPEESYRNSLPPVHIQMDPTTSVPPVESAVSSEWDSAEDSDEDSDEGIPTYDSASYERAEEYVEEDAEDDVAAKDWGYETVVEPMGSTPPFSSELGMSPQPAGDMGFEFAAPRQKIDLGFAIKNQLEAIKQINPSNCRIFDVNEVRKDIQELKAYLTEIEKNLP